MRVYGVLPAGVIAALVVVVGTAAWGSDDLMERAEQGRPVRVIARMPVAETPAAMRGTAAGDEKRRVAIRAARRRLEEDLGETAWQVTHAFENVPYVALEVGADALRRLRLTDRATGIVEDRLETILLGESGPLVQADQARAAGYDGRGWTVAVVDTGVDAAHSFLAGKVVAEACFSANGSCPNGSTEQTGAGAGRPCDFAASACAHGTHVAGIVAGNGETVDGIAPGANVIAIQVFSEFSGNTCDDDTEDPCAKTYTSDTIRALDHVYSLRNSFQIAAVNLSLGGGQYTSQPACDRDESARKAIIDELRAVGIATVAAAGNESQIDALASPACISSVVGVGATNDFDQVAGFSNSAAFLDLLAPGVQILSSVPGGAAIISGTSQATPHVSAAFAVLNQRLGVGDVDRTLAALTSTGLPVLDARNNLTTPRIQILDALSVLPGGPATSGLQITPDGKRTLVSKDIANERWAITLNADDGTVTGNVFQSDGSEPSFVWCEWVGDDGNPDPYERQITFDCSGASACPGPSCPAGQWSVLATVSLPGSFFLPPLSTASVGPGNAGTPSGVLVDSPSGVQITPDQKRILVSKDVGGDRWAITRNHDDETVTGNVFTPGAEPTFLWCGRQSDNGDPDPANVLITYGCYTADRCTGEPCDGSQWHFLQSVVVPGWFFLP